MSNKKSSFLVVVLLLFLMLVSSWMYLNSQLDFQAHHEKVESVNKLQQESARLLNDILLVESGNRNNLDKVASSEQLVSALLSEQDVNSDKNKALVTEVAGLLSNITRIKSSYAVFLNSVTYFPESVSLLRQKLFEKDATKLIQEVNSLERIVLRYSAFGAAGKMESVSRITTKIESLKRTFSATEPSIREPALAMIRHAYVLLSHAEKLRKLNDDALNNQIAVASKQVLSVLGDELNKAIMRTQNVKAGFYISIFVLLFLSFILWNRQRQVMQSLAENTKSLSLALKTTRQNQFSIDVEKRVITLGKAYIKELGSGSKEYHLSIEGWIAQLHPDEEKEVASLLQASLTTGVDFNIEYRWKGRDNSWIWVSSIGRIIEYDGGGKPLKMSGISTNITERKANEHVLRVIAESNPANASAKDVLGTIIKELALAKNVKYALIAKVNEADSSMVDTLAVWAGNEFADNFSYSLVGTPCQNIVDDGVCLYPDSVQELFPDDHILKEMEVVSYLGVPLKNNHNKVVGLLALLDLAPIAASTQWQSLMKSLATRIAMEIDRAEADYQLMQMAHYDVLTGLPNRALLMDRFSQAQAHGARKGTLLAVCFVDLDDFKPVNDEYGHEVGDELLKEVARRLLDSIRQEDTVSRLGGDEFVLLLSELSAVEECQLSLDRVIQTISEPYHVFGLTLHVSASIGFTLSGALEDELDSLIRQADQAMYTAKIKGKNRHSRFNAELDQLTTKKHIELSEIRRALMSEEFCLYYQPKVNMKTGEVYGAEALIRWNHPERGLIPPLSFLPIIDGDKLEVAVGDWVVSSALRQMEAWKEAGIELEVSVNISPYHLLSRGFMDMLKSQLECYALINPGKLQLEIVESSVIGDIQKVSKILQSVKDELGVKIALDDFGTGYSSLTHLRKIPAGTVKIDRAFIRDILADSNALTIVKSVVGLADSFSLDVIAEGVEFDEQGLKLLEIGCVNAQGYGIAKPMPAGDLPSWLESYQPNLEWVNFSSLSLISRL
ncbi:hypothetical protein A9Q85_08615 [Cycloclasticus sp. 44_32_T64]|nr:hypothetical protein A9Q85_08615 [Cycloclasticus sp. 44_32_T64]